jgi:hypothetical protein
MLCESENDNMPFYAGVDMFAYPGDRDMSTILAKTNLSWTGFYLAPTPDRQNTSWMTSTSYTALTALGWGIAPVYLARQPGFQGITTANGTGDANRAMALADTAAFPSGYRLFFDYDPNAAPDTTYLRYYAAWVAQVVANGFKPGLYARAEYVKAFRAADARSTIWCVSPKYTVREKVLPNYITYDPRVDNPYASMSQFKLDASTIIDGTTYDVDISTSSIADPGTG